MLRPYLAIIKDSFRAALASRVLYVLLGSVTLLLAALAPLHLQESLDWEIKADVHIRDPQRLAELLVTRHERPVIGRVWSRFSESLQNQMRELSAEEPAPPTAGRPSRLRDDDRVQALADGLNAILDDADFYDEQIWKGQFIDAEAQQLLARDAAALTDEQRRRLNRLLLSRALRPELLPADDTRIDTKYGPWRLDFLSVSGTHQQLARNVSGWISYIFDKFVLSIGLVIAILVTSNMIPEMFEAGSLNLLLSKPISRSMLIVSKFIGGCAFVALLAGYLFSGLWLWLGWGMGIWDRSILLSIPLYTVVFAIYYSVSVLVGVIWRSAVLSVVVTAIFWAFCFVIGLLYSLFHNRTHQERLVSVIPSNDRRPVVAVDALQRAYQWESQNRQWKRLTRLADSPEDEMGLAISLFFVELPQFPGIGAVLDETTQTLLRAVPSFSDPESFSQLQLEVSQREPVAFVSAGRLPANTAAIVPTAEGPIVVAEGGAFRRLDLRGLLESTRQTDDATASGPLGSLGNLLPSPNSDLNPFLKSQGPDQPQFVAGSKQVAWCAATQELLVVSRGSIFAFRLQENEFRLQREQKLLSAGRGASLRGMVTGAGTSLLVAMANGRLLLLDAASLEPKGEWLPESRSAPIGLAASRDGRYFAVNYRNGQSWIVDATTAAPPTRLEIRGVGKQHGIAFGEENQLWIAHDLDRITAYALDRGTTVEQFQPGGDVLKSIHRWIVRPIYRVCPKPGEFYKLVNRLSSTSDTRYSPDIDLTEVPEYEDPWSPLTTGFVFMALCLAVACWVFQWSDY